MSLIDRLFGRMPGRSLLSDGGWVIATQIVGKGSAALLTLWLARSLSVRDYAQLTFLLATATLLSSYLAAGLPLAISRLVAEGRDQRSWASDERLGAVLFITAITFAIGLIATPLYLPLLQSDEVPTSGILLICGAFAITASALAQAGLYGSGRFRAAFAPVIVATAVLVTVTAIALAIGSQTLLIAGHILAMAVPAIAYIPLMVRDGVLVQAHVRLLPPRRAVSEVLRMTLPGLGFSVIYATINWLLARTLIEQQVTPDQYNLFSIGLQWFSLVLFIPLAFGQVLFPRYIQKAQGGALNADHVLVPAGLTFGMVLLGAVAATLLTPALTWLYGGAYRFTPEFVFTILLAAAVSGSVTILGSFVMASRGMTVWLLVNLAMFAAAVALLWAVPPATAFAAARTLCLTQLVALIIAIGLILDHRMRRNNGSVSPSGL